MLFQLVDQICADIDRLSLGTVAPELEQQIMACAPEAVRQLIDESSRFGAQPSEAAAASVLALSAFGYIKGIPAIARQMVEKVVDNDVPVGRRCAVASVLAYLVQKRDLIPDDAPGGYGYLDDVILLRAGLVAYLGSLPQSASNVDAEAKIIVFLAKLTPKPLRESLQQAVSTMSQGVQVMVLLEPSMAEFMLGQMIANPLNVPSPVAPLGFVPRPVLDYTTARWTGGAYFESNNMMVPGGPAPNEERLYIPS